MSQAVDQFRLLRLSEAASAVFFSRKLDVYLLID